MKKQALLRRLPHLLYAGIACFCLQTAYAHDVDLGVAGGYAAFILGDVSDLGVVEGRLAVARDLRVKGLGVGAKLPGDRDDAPALVVGRHIHGLDKAEIWANGGKKGYGVFAGNKENTDNQWNLRKSDSPIDFESESLWLALLSAQLKDRAATGTADLQGINLTLQGKNADIEVFHLTAEQVARGKNLKLKNIKSKAYLILNVAADKQLQVKFGLMQAALKNRQQRVLFNFPNADVLLLDDVQVWGSVLALRACVQGFNSRINGTVVAATWKSKAEIGHAPFDVMP